MSCAWCLIFWILDFTTGDWYINILYVHCFAGTWLPEKLFMETYQWKILSLKDVYLLIGWYPPGVIFVIYWLLKTLLDVLHVHSKDVYSCADCGLQYWIWTYDEQWTSRAVHFTVSNERLVLKKGDICQEQYTCGLITWRTWERSAVIDILWKTIHAIFCQLNLCFVVVIMNGTSFQWLT